MTEVVGAIGIETVRTSAPSVADRREDDPNPTTQDDARRRGVSASVEPTIGELERAIVKATLGGRLGIAELLADRLRIRVAGERRVANLPKRPRVMACVSVATEKRGRENAE